MDGFSNQGRVEKSGETSASFSWLIMDRYNSSGNKVYFGLNGNSGVGGVAHLANSMTPEEAEAIGYSLLAAAKAARSEA